MREAIQNTVSFEEEARLRESLYVFLAEQTEKYTCGESSSLPVETAERLFASLCYCLGLRPEDGAQGLAPLVGRDIHAAFAEGQERLEKECKRGKRLWNILSSRLCTLDSISMQDTFRSIGGFFRAYEPRYFAHEIPCDIDYPLALPVEGAVQGVDYVNVYLESLAAENDFLRHFRLERVQALLASHFPSYKELIMNLYEPVATNALGLTLLGEDVSKLGIGAYGCRRLQASLCERGEEGVAAALCGAALTLSQAMGMRGREAAYLYAYANLLAPRVSVACYGGGMEGIFLTIV